MSADYSLLAANYWLLGVITGAAIHGSWLLAATCWLLDVLLPVAACGLLLHGDKQLADSSRLVAAACCLLAAAAAATVAHP